MIRHRNHRRFHCEFLFLASIASLLVVVGPAHATFPGTNGQIAFGSDMDGDFDIYIMNSDGTGVTQLTFNTASDRYPWWSPDGTKILFASDRDGDFEIFVMNPDGSGQTQLTFNLANDQLPHWSPDGTRIAFASTQDGDFEVWTMNADGSGQTQLTFNAEEDLPSDWSPDGGKIAFSRGASRSGTEIWVMNADGTAQEQRTSNSVQDVFARWSPDGSKLLFRRELAFGAGWAELFSMNPDGTGEINLTNTPTKYEGEGVYSPDGTKIVLNTDDGTGSGIFVMNAGGGGQTQIMNSPGYDSDLDWRQIICIGRIAETFDQGPLPPMYLYLETAPCGPPVVAGGELVMSFSAGCSSPAPAQTFRSDKNVAVLCGDFDVSVDYRLIDFATATGPGNGYRVAGLEIDRASDDTHVATIARFTQAADGCYATGQYYTARTSTPGCAPGVAATDHTEGGLRITRVGSLARMYYRGPGPGSWVELYSGVVTTDKVHFAVHSGNRDLGVSQDVRYDNLNVSAAGVLAADIETPPVGIALRPNAPNPFQSTTQVSYDLPHGQHVDLSIFDVTGRRVRQLVDGYRPAGTHSTQWDGDDDHGRKLGAGVYLSRLRVGGATAVGRLALIP
jgi:hypothetical protein